MDSKELAKYIDYTNLNNNASRREIKKMVDEAIHYGFAGLCIAPAWTSFVKYRLQNADVTDIKVMTVPNYIMGGGFQQCTGITDSVCEECDEIDYIWNTYEFGDLKVWDKTEEELKKIRKMTKGELKIIIEAHYLRMVDEKIHKQGMKTIIKNACNLVNKSGADWIKTDSGLFKREDFDTLLEDCLLMIKYSKNGVKVKAAGGIENKFQVESLINIGVKRIGTSKAVEIVTSNI